MIEPHAELIDVRDLLLDRRQVLERGARRRQRHVLQERRRDRIDAARPECWLFANGVQAPVVGIVSGSQIGAKPGEVAAAHRRRTAPRTCASASGRIRCPS